MGAHTGNEQGQQEVTPSRQFASVKLIAAVAFLLLFAWLATQVLRGQMTNFDLAVASRIHEFSSPGLTTMMRVFSLLGSVVFVITASLIFIAVSTFTEFTRRHRARAMVWVMGGAIVLENVLKFAFHRARPPDSLFGPAPHTFSFPSGHAIFSMCFYTVLAVSVWHALRSPALRAMLCIATAGIITAIGVSRIYLGMHYASDVLGGYLVAASWLLILCYVRVLCSRPEAWAG